MSLQHRLARAALRAPTWLVRLVARGVDTTADGYTLDPQIQLIAGIARRVRLPRVASGTVEAARRSLWRARGLLDHPEPRVASRTAIDAGGVPSRLYRPTRPHRSTTPRPGLVFFHGGGAVAGDLDTHDLTCRFIADRAGCAVISVDYRLAPEHRFPAAPDDALVAYRWVRDNAAALDLDDHRIGVAGDSFGGNLAAVVCLEALAGEAPMPALQLLIYPWVDMSMRQPSIATFADGFPLGRADVEWFRARYLESEDQRTDPRASPLDAPSFAGLCPAVILTAGFDLLRDEGRAYADALAAAGVDVSYTCHGGLIHGFAGMVALIDEARRALSQAAAQIADRL